MMQRSVRTFGYLVIGIGAAGLIVAPFFGAVFFSDLWGIEPLTYIGAAVVMAGLVVISLSYIVSRWVGDKKAALEAEQKSAERWGELTQQYFELFHHDLGRPLRRILGKERELRSLLKTSESELYPQVRELLDEIEGQAPSFRLMMSNIQVLVQLEAPTAPVHVQPVEPSEVIRKIVDRYGPIAAEEHKELTWWSDPPEFGIIYSDSSAIEHIVANLVDNTVRFADHHVEIKLSKNLTHFFVRVWDDGPGIAPHYLRHIFDRGWTPAVAKGEEKTSSGLGLFIARTLANRYGGDLTVESLAEPEGDHHTSFLLSLPIDGPPVAVRPR